MTVLKWLLAAVVAYGGFVAIMYLAQRSLMYFPETARVAPAAAGLPHVEEVILHSADGEELVAWHSRPADNRLVVLYFHGNGGSLRWRADRFRGLIADGTGLVALSYRGYGGSSGRPSEEGLIADADAAYAFATARYGSERIVAWGESLGTGVVAWLAAERPVARVILESAFTSALDIAAATYSFLPVRRLMKDTFRSDERVGRITAPVLMIHGEKDTIVPVKYGERLFAMIRAPKRFARLPAAQHNDHDEHGARELVRLFLEGRFDRGN